MAKGKDPVPDRTDRTKAPHPGRSKPRPVPPGKPSPQVPPKDDKRKG